MNDATGQKIVSARLCTSEWEARNVRASHATTARIVSARLCTSYRREASRAHNARGIATHPGGFIHTLESVRDALSGALSSADYADEICQWTRDSVHAVVERAHNAPTLGVLLIAARSSRPYYSESAVEHDLLTATVALVRARVSWGTTTTYWLARAQRATERAQVAVTGRVTA